MAGAIAAALRPGLLLLPLLVLQLLQLGTEAPEPPEVAPSCRGGVAGLTSIGQVYRCLDELLSTIDASDSGPGVDAELESMLRKARRNAEAGREACSSTEQKLTAIGCRALSDLSFQMLAEGAAALAACRASVARASSGADPAAVESGGCLSRDVEASDVIVATWQSVESAHRNVPLEGMVSTRLRQLSADALGPALEVLQSASQGGLGGRPADELSAAWRTAIRAVDRLRYWLEGYIWRETHWLWLTDSLNAGRVVHTAWGSPEEWQAKFGAHDCLADSPLVGGGPRYQFSDLLGMRWDTLARLLRELRERRGDPNGKLVLVEVGVFAGLLAHHLLPAVDFVTLIGVDPYIGSDGTFPGNFSESLDPDIAMYKAASTMDQYKDRAMLLTVASEEAATSIPDGSVDALFIDGCHLYDCVKSDFDAWMPKLRRGVDTLVAGHDFSPQWPGVVRAVHERRPGEEVHLASDWTFWWHERLEP
eukprot:TRINITY_DN8659_c1_g1_i1.p1 TRINITY_DN8659_c1_g1~~TRINITY_DN8659_c1_g1_i1.p1  ORF type:complete len:529 (+),score=98.82 TRINITY_DN8659_c1_g1_i1:151-1587(+)